MPDRPENAPSSALAKVQELFHGLIRARARGGGISVPRKLPKLADAAGTAAEPAWFPVRGMYGGFAYWLDWQTREPELHSQSWSRVIAGSGQYHVITSKEIRLIDEGFV